MGWSGGRPGSAEQSAGRWAGRRSFGPVAWQTGDGVPNDDRVGQGGASDLRCLTLGCFAAAAATVCLRFCTKCGICTVPRTPFTGCPVSSMRSTVLFALSGASLFCLIACGSEDDSGAAPSFSLDAVGAPCEAFAPCGPAGSVCLPDFPGGFCAIPCLTRVDCPNGSECIEFQDTAVCVAGCASSVECRAGYVCENTEGLDGYVAAVCVVDDGDPPAPGADAGAADAGGTDGSGVDSGGTDGSGADAGPPVTDGSTASPDSGDGSSP